MPNYRRTPLAERFWRLVAKGDGCWTWLGTKTCGGYGKIHVSGEARQSRRSAWAHRVSWELANGPIPGGLFVCHQCDNPSCVRPDHLFLGTNDDNMQDAKRKGRNAKGERHGMAKLSDEDVREIRRRSAAGDTAAALGARFGVHPPAISRVLTGQRRKDVL